MKRQPGDTTVVHSLLGWHCDDLTGFGTVAIADIAAGVGMSVSDLESGPLRDLAISRDVIFYECPEGMLDYFMLAVMSHLHGFSYDIPEDKRGKMPKRMPARREGMND